LDTLCGMEVKSADPQGKYIISLNKLAIDRFDPVGPLPSTKSPTY